MAATPADARVRGRRGGDDDVDLEKLVADQPLFHQYRDGTMASWAIDRKPLEFICRHVRPGMRTLETGAGHSTVAFAIAGADHICVTPSVAEAERIEAYCRENGLSPRIRFVHESSEFALARPDALPEELDFVLIDGAHRFPYAILDWHYTDSKLRAGGFVGIDDYRMPSVNVLCRFLDGEDDWELVETTDNTAFYRKLRVPVVTSDWQHQKMNAADRWPGPAGPAGPVGWKDRARRLLGRP